MSRTAPIYGRRGQHNETQNGIRPTASTYGKASIETYSEKANGHIFVESEAERLVAHMLTIDPRIKAFRPQPFTVDVVRQDMLETAEAVRAAQQRYRDLPAPKFYTPDFEIERTDGLFDAIEVKTEGFEGDAIYQKKIARARGVLEANNYILRMVVLPTSPSHPIRMNVQALKRASHIKDRQLSAELIERVFQRCENGPVTLQALCTDLQIAPGLIPFFLVSGILAGDLAHQVLCGTFELSLAHGNLDHLCLLEQVER